MGFILNLIGFLLLIFGGMFLFATSESNKDNLLKMTFGAVNPTESQLWAYDKVVSKLRNTSFVSFVVGTCILLARLFS